MRQNSCDEHYPFRAGCSACRARARRYHERYQLDRMQGSARTIEATGTKRRVRALMAIGHTQTDVALSMGVTKSRIADLLRRDRVTLAVAARVQKTYRQLSMVPGSSLETKKRALRAGWPPPLAWDEDALDDPSAFPAPMGDPPAGRFRLHLEDVQFLLESGESEGHIARRLGVSVSSIEKACYRAGRTDLLDRLRPTRQEAA